MCGVLTCSTLLLCLVQVTGLGYRHWSGFIETQFETRSKSHFLGTKCCGCETCWKGVLKSSRSYLLLVMVELLLAAVLEDEGVTGAAMFHTFA